MQNNIFLLPLYNDWKSLQKLLKEINNQLKILREKADIFVVDDNSKNTSKITIKKFKNIKKLNILKLKKNLGSQKAISIGLRYIHSLKINSIITVMDSDGEDDSSKIPEMISSAKRNKDCVIVSCRNKRKEGLIFDVLYKVHKVITCLFAARLINFGSYSSFYSQNLKKILSNNSTWFAYSSALSKNCKLLRLFADRKKRFYGKSKLSLFGLFLHSLRVNCVFLFRVILISLTYIFLFYLFKLYFSSYFIIPIILIILFNLLLVAAYLYTEPSKFYKSLIYIKSKTGN